MAFAITRSETHLTLFRRVHVKREHVKVSLVYASAALLTFDFAGSLLGPACLPHVWHMVEFVSTFGGKLGAAAGGFVPFFDRVVDAAVQEGA